MAQDVRLMYPHGYNFETDTYEIKVDGELYLFTSEQWNDFHFMNSYSFGETIKEKWLDEVKPLIRPRMTSATYKAAIDEATVQMELFTLFEENVVEMEYVGSRVTCVPAPTDTDEDVLILTDNLGIFVRRCNTAGFKDTGSYTGAAFHSLRHGEINLIITNEKEFYDKFMLATHVCKCLNVLDKQHRITVFQSILYGKAYGKP